MHDEAFQYLKVARALDLFARLDKQRVLELGSYDVNGSPRELFGDAWQYVGVDTRAGKGVDVVADAETYRAPKLFDVVISTETLEHTPFPEQVVNTAWANLKPGGVLILTAAAAPRLPHSCDGDTQLKRGEYYTNVAPAWLESMLIPWDVRDITYDPAHGDIYAIAVRPDNVLELLTPAKVIAVDASRAPDIRRKPASFA